MKLYNSIAYTLTLMIPMLGVTGCMSETKTNPNTAAQKLIDADTNKDGVLSKPEAANKIIQRLITGEGRRGFRVNELTPEIEKQIKEEVENAETVVPEHAKTYLKVLAELKEIYADNFKVEKDDSTQQSSSENVKPKKERGNYSRIPLKAERE